MPASEHPDRLPAVRQGPQGPASGSSQSNRGFPTLKQTNPTGHSGVWAVFCHRLARGLEVGHGAGWAPPLPKPTLPSGRDV